MKGGNFDKVHKGFKNHDSFNEAALHEGRKLGEGYGTPTETVVPSMRPPFMKGGNASSSITNQILTVAFNEAALHEGRKWSFASRD